MEWVVSSMCRITSGSLLLKIGSVQAPPDGLLSLTIDYKNDPSDRKLDIGVGAYRTEVSLTRVVLNWACASCHHKSDWFSLLVLASGDLLVDLFASTGWKALRPERSSEGRKDAHGWQDSEQGRKCSEFKIKMACDWGSPVLSSIPRDNPRRYGMGGQPVWHCDRLIVALNWNDLLECTCALMGSTWFGKLYNNRPIDDRIEVGALKLIPKCNKSTIIT